MRRSGRVVAAMRPSGVRPAGANAVRVLSSSSANHHQPGLRPAWAYQDEVRTNREEAIKDAGKQLANLWVPDPELWDASDNDETPFEYSVLDGPLSVEVGLFGDPEGSSAKTLELNVDVFGGPVNPHLMHRVVLWQRSRWRAGTAKVKNIRERRGSGESRIRKRAWEERGRDQRAHRTCAKVGASTDRRATACGPWISQRGSASSAFALRYLQSFRKVTCTSLNQ